MFHDILVCESSNFQCRIAFTALADYPRYNIEMN